VLPRKCTPARSTTASTVSLAPAAARALATVFSGLPAAPSHGR
jgi:hypothetical protein